MSRSLSLDVKVGDSIDIDGGRIVVCLKEKSGQLARLHFKAGADISIVRSKAPVKTAAEMAMRGIRFSTAS